MKKNFITFILMIAVLPLIKAQSVGERWVGGSVGFTTTKVTDFERVYNYNITPEFGYILTDKFALGISVGYDHNEHNSYYSIDGDTKEYVVKRDGFTINPFVRYTFLKGNIGGLFVDGGVKYGHYKTRYIQSDDKENDFEIGFRPGVALVLSSKLSLVGRFGFLGYSQQKREADKRDTFGFNFDMNNVSLGVNVIF